MNNFKGFIGIDISKEVFDVSFIKELNDKSIHNQFTNNISGVKDFIKWIKSLDLNKDEFLICMEHTGLYGKILLSDLIINGYNLWAEMSLKILRSGGVQRGKNDKIDAERIAIYALKNQGNAKVHQPNRIIIEKIRALISLREKLVTYRASLLKTRSEFKNFNPDISKLINSYHSNSLKGIQKDLDKIEKQLDNLISSDENLNALFNQIVSVSGVGKVTAVLLICLTNEFKNFNNPRQLSCYAGVVPFEYSSGKSIRTRPKVHYIANKRLKKALHMCAISACKNDPEIRDYFLRKVAEGKNKMLVINNVRNKLVHRICACVKQGKLYEKSFLKKK